MNTLIDLWVSLVTSFEKKLNDVPNKIKSDVICKLIEIGFVTDDDIEDVREAKINQMSEACNQAIVNGFDIEMSDGQQHHFDLELEDQLKISKLNDRAKAGMETMPYHASGEACKFYTADEIMKLNTQMENMIEFQTTYFNSLRDYINSFDSIEEVMNLQYGVEIPEEYQSEVLKAMYKQMSEA